MEIDIRAVRRLRESAGAQASLAPLVEALCRTDADLSALRVVCDWIQYKSNFRDTAMVRAVLGAVGPVPASVGPVPVGTSPVSTAPVEGYELAVDLRRCAKPETDVAAE